MPDDQRTSMDLHEQPGHLTRRLQQAHKLLWAELVADDLTSPQFAVLNLLEQHPNIDQRRLSELVGMDRSTTAEIVQRLLARRLLTRVKDVRDGRRNVLRLDPRGVQLLRRTLPAAAEVSRELVAVLSDRDRQEFLRILNLLVEAHSERLSDISVS